VIPLQFINTNFIKINDMTRIILLLIFIAFQSTPALSAEALLTNMASLSESQQATVKSWVNFAINATEQSLGKLKQNQIKIKLVPKNFTSEPVPWGNVIRSHLEGVEIHFNRYASASSLIHDWTLYHELAHLYHPLFNYRDFWVSEGLATYLQNKIMLDASIISRDEFIHRLWNGLQRGRLQTLKINNALYDVSENMWSLHAQQRVYWTGTAFFIEAQTALSKKSSTKYSISGLINQYQKCCRSKNKQAKVFLAELDKLSQSAIFSNLYQKYKYRTDFPKITKEQISQLHF
jgi:hypothetical protein